jgi:hypothetical protein
MKRNRIWIIGIILSAAAGFVAVERVSAPTPPNTTPMRFTTITPEINITDTPAYTNGQCAYTWAYHNAPELTEKLSAAFLAIDPVINVRAEYYGEDCVYADGHSTFGAMETDFYVRIPVDDLTNEEAFGNWMSQAMKIVIEIPREQIQGNYGFVEFWFEKSEGEHLIVRVPIQQYKDSAQTKTGVELFRMFYVKP